MSRWFRVYDDLVDDPKVQRLSARSFRRLFHAALAGKPSPFSEHVRRDRGRPSGAAWTQLRAAVFERDDYTCSYCDERGGRLECDHILPVSRGGLDAMGNLATACFRCNRSKRDKTPEEWRQ
jgi:5-methylcytosine-specific restriction endonuclease McrA